MGFYIHLDQLTGQKTISESVSNSDLHDRILSCHETYSDALWTLSVMVRNEVRTSFRDGFIKGKPSDSHTLYQRHGKPSCWVHPAPHGVSMRGWAFHKGEQHVFRLFLSNLEANLFTGQKSLPIEQFLELSGQKVNEKKEEKEMKEEMKEDSYESFTWCWSESENSYWLSRDTELDKLKENHAIDSVRTNITMSRIKRSLYKGVVFLTEGFEHRVRFDRDYINTDGRVISILEFKASQLSGMHDATVYIEEEVCGERVQSTLTLAQLETYEPVGTKLECVHSYELRSDGVHFTTGLGPSKNPTLQPPKPGEVVRLGLEPDQLFRVASCRHTFLDFGMVGLTSAESTRVKLVPLPIFLLQYEKASFTPSLVGAQ